MGKEPQGSSWGHWLVETRWIQSRHQREAYSWLEGQRVTWTGRVGALSYHSGIGSRTHWSQLTYDNQQLTFAKLTWVQRAPSGVPVNPHDSPLS